jgi:glycosyltransferase involved in cell wall biosynthesis
LVTAGDATSWPLLAPAPDGPPVVRGEPSFSVVIAAYQAESSIGDALDSVLSQTVAPLEVVVCDDGSTDGTAAVLARYAGRIRVLWQSNTGEAAAKNAAVRASGGEYVVVLDADDVFLPQRLEALRWAAAVRPDLDVLTTDAVVEADGTPVRNAYHAGWTFPVEDQRAAIVDRNFVFGLAAVRRERWLEVGGFDEALSRTTDWDFWMRLILSGSRVGLLNVPLARYRLSSGTLSSDRVRLLRGRVAVLTRAAGRDDLSPHERATVAAALRRERRDLLLREAEAALRAGGRTARRAGARVVVVRGVSSRTRLSGVAQLLLPGLLLRRRVRRAGGTVEIGAGLRVSRPGQPD